jgi:calcineurin-like phosphoesterase family protein
MGLILTSDHHFGHPGILASCARPFADVAAMEDALVEKWNAVVGPKDDVIHMGDFSWRMRRADGEALFARLNGNKYLQPGNHDDKYVRRLPWKGLLPAIHEVRSEGETLVLSHYPLRSWNKARHGTRHVYGHVHGRLPATRQSIDVGVDSWAYSPVPVERLIAVMDTFPAIEFRNGDPIISYADIDPAAAPSPSPGAP